MIVCAHALGWLHASSRVWASARGEAVPMTAARGKAALLTFLCNSSDHHGHGWADQLLRAHRLGLSVTRLSPIRKIAVMHGFGAEVVGAAGIRSLTQAG